MVRSTARAGVVDCSENKGKNYSVMITENVRQTATGGGLIRSYGWNVQLWVERETGRVKLYASERAEGCGESKRTPKSRISPGAVASTLWGWVTPLLDIPMGTGPSALFYCCLCYHSDHRGAMVFHRQCWLGGRSRIGYVEAVLSLCVNTYNAVKGQRLRGRNLYFVLMWPIGMVVPPGGPLNRAYGRWVHAVPHPVMPILYRKRRRGATAGWVIYRSGCWLKHMGRKPGVVA
jgi:hypothetical protein